MTVLPDVLEPGLRVVFCGSAVGAASARLGAPYAGPGNKFWPTLAQTKITPRLIAPQEYRLVPRFGIGLTDLNKTESGADSDLSKGADDPHALVEKIERHCPRILAFTAKRPAQVFAKAILGRRRIDYGLQPETLGTTAIFVLPSPSGLAIRYWNVEYWQALADLARGR